MLVSNDPPSTVITTRYHRRNNDKKIHGYVMDLGIKRGIRFGMLENPIVYLKPKIPNTIKKKQFPME